MSVAKKVLVSGLVAIALPIVLVATAVGRARRFWVERRARAGKWGPRREVSVVPPNQLWLSWMSCSEDEAMEALRDAVTLLTRILPSALGISAVVSMEIESPAPDFDVQRSRLHVQPSQSDSGRLAAVMLNGERTEEGFLVVNTVHRLPLDLDARSFVAGHLAVELPRAPDEALLRTLRCEFEIKKA